MSGTPYSDNWVDYHVVGKFGGVFNLEIWQSGEKLPNYIPPILNPRDPGRPAGHSSTYYYTHRTSILSRECNIGDSSLSGKEFSVANDVHSWGRLKQTTANRPYEFGLTSEYNKYTLERPNGPAKALSQFEIASYRDSINNKAWLTS